MTNVTKRTIANCILYPCGTFALALGLAAKSGLIELDWTVATVLLGLTVVCMACAIYKDLLAYREKLEGIYE